ncbi:MAG: DUF4422 domain-containing protein [Lachnospiraceae bacterium]|nr:DUF4422 domain-containing protein [Lachnospiraceae bacterium]
MDRASVKIYTMTHKAFLQPPDKLYVPLLCGADCISENGAKRCTLSGTEAYLKDNEGDNISAKNPYYSELTGLYWAWKNDTDSEVLGLAHYRRFLLDDNGKMLNESRIKQILDGYDIITTKQIVLDYPYEEAFGGKHAGKDFNILREVISSCYPEYREIFEETASGTHTYFANMMIARRDIFDAYCGWLFDILFSMEKRVDMTGYNDYQKRLYGFVSELLLMVWIRYKGLKVKECSVAVIGEKKETAEALKVIGDLLGQKDLQGAAEYFMGLYGKRPDILMDASDINGGLKHMVMLIQRLLKDQEDTGHSYLEEETDICKLMSHYGIV